MKNKTSRDIPGFTHTNRKLGRHTELDLGSGLESSYVSLCPGPGLVDWLIGLVEFGWLSLVGCLVGCLVDWLVDWLVG